MTNKIKYPWLVMNDLGVEDTYFNVRSAKYDIKDNPNTHDEAVGKSFLAYAEPFEPIKLTQDDAGQIESIANKNSLKAWYENLGLLDYQIAFLYLHRNNWRDFVEIEPEKKYYLISEDIENVGNKYKFLNRYQNGKFSFDTKYENDLHKTKFTQAEIDEFGDRVKNLRKEEVK
ncbi:hypothetical protein [Oenococcus sicerae]|uniref:DUF1642 domain-containing protein n=1 Tax=Oenococcus sicerae TaxID=2203724 RepID=A0AAJ1R965_9LACO|nr:hypothetical protein [Oenococcus sicerae]MDN6899555.1 hypothetical protein [Oenococcus sicerae]